MPRSLLGSSGSIPSQLQAGDGQAQARNRCGTWNKFGDIEQSHTAVTAATTVECRLGSTGAKADWYEATTTHCFNPCSTFTWCSLEVRFSYCTDEVPHIEPVPLSHCDAVRM
jgi:hypothetical protein